MAQFKSVLGRRHDGRPIYMIAGGSTAEAPPEPPTPDPAQQGFEQGQQEAQQQGRAPAPPEHQQELTAAQQQAMTPEQVEEAIQRAKEQARTEERQKLYPRLEKVDTLENEIKELRNFREEIRQREEQQAREAEQAARQAELEGLPPEFVQQLQATEQRWEEKFNQERQERMRQEAIFAKERELQELEEYRRSVIAQHSSEVAPQLVGFIRGDSREEIDDAVARAIDASNQILQEVSQQQQAQRQQAPGVRATSPASGPMELQEGQRTLSPEEIAAMPMNEWVTKYRSQHISQPTQRGLYG